MKCPITVRSPVQRRTMPPLSQMQKTILAQRDRPSRSGQGEAKSPASTGVAHSTAAQFDASTSIHMVQRLTCGVSRASKRSLRASAPRRGYAAFPLRNPGREVFTLSLGLHNAYLARLNTASTLAPSVVEGLTYFNSSVVRLVIIRFSSSPSEFGYVLPSTRNITVLSPSLTEYVPK